MSCLTLKCYLLFIVFSLLQFNVLAQNYSAQKVDSLKQQALTCDSIGMEAIVELHNYYYSSGSDDKALRNYIQRAIDCAKSKNDIFATLRGYRYLLRYYSLYPGVDSTLIISSKIFDLVEKDTSIRAQKIEVETLSFIAVQYYQDDDLETAYSYAKKTIDQAYEKQFYDIYIQTITYLVNFYLYDSKNEEAINIANEGLSNLPDINKVENTTLFRKTNIESLKFYKSHLSFQKASAILYNPDQSREDKIKAYDIIVDWMEENKEQTRFYLEGTSLILETLSDILPIDTLLAYGEEGLLLVKGSGDISENIYRFHGKNLIKTGQYRKAKTALETAIPLAKAQTDWFYELSDTYKALAEVHLELGETKKAKERLDLYSLYVDSSYVRKNENALENIEAKYALTQKEAENIVIKKEAQNLSERVKLFRLIGVLLFVLLALALVFYYQQRKNTKKLQHLNETKNKILAILGHDLKGPSAAFNNLSQKLSFLIKQNDINRLMELAPYYEKNGERLSVIINDVLNWALSENESFLNNPEDISILPIIEQAVEDLDWSLNDKNVSINISVSDGDNIIFDKNAFTIINRNILHNAIKFSPIDSSINIQYNKQNKNLEYLDHGKGMSAEVASKILSGIPVESDTGTNNERGMGIGLVTCLKLIEQNKGELFISNNSPSGTVIRLKFA